MRRLGSALVVLTLASCKVVRDAFSAHPNAAGHAAGQTLTVERLADLAGRASEVPLGPEALTGLTTVYLDYAVFAGELARGRNLDDSALVLAAGWPSAAQLKWQHFQDRLRAARPPLTPAQTDSAYQAGTVRLFQHILISIPANAAPNVEQQKKRQATGILRQAAAQPGVGFARLAQRYSEDPGTKSQGGYLAAVRRGRFVPAFDTAAWQLAPGGLSAVVRSPFGYHIIRRPPLAEVRDSFRVDIENDLVTQLDSLHLDSLSRLRRLEVEAGAPALVRWTMEHLGAAGTDRRTLATYQVGAGAFRVHDLARWILAIDPKQARGLASAGDDQLKRFVRILTQRELQLQQADSAGVQLTSEDWRQIKVDHDSGLTILRNFLGLSAQLFKDSAATEKARMQLAMSHVNAYLDHVFLNRSARFFPVPPFLATTLRGADWSINEAGVARALTRAQAIRIRADSGRVEPGKGLRLAPGPAPVPGPGDSVTGKPRR